MTCEVCGDDCRCGLQAPSAEAEDLSEQFFQASLEGETGKAAVPGPLEPEGPMVEATATEREAAQPVADPVPEEDPEAWRSEVAARLSHYRARRKPKPPRYPSLWLEFDSREPAAMRPVSMESVAREDFAEPVPVAHALAAIQEPPVPAKILAFPRSSAAPPAPMLELADPVPSQPRILEVAETPAPPPALGGITMEAAKDERRLEEKSTVRPAHWSRRLVAAGVDGLVVALSCALAAEIFWRIARVRLPAMQSAAIAMVAAIGLWAAYQYLLIVYSGSTPGLWLAQLEIACLNGARVTRSRRRWRVLASFLSAASLGLGYLWAAIEADSLGWHDRMTGTCVAMKTSNARR